MRIKIYTKADRAEWNAFVDASKNGTFLFHRDFMEYHANRFEDYSLLFYRKNMLVALLPGNIKDHVFYSHQGLTYGGLIMSKDTTSQDALQAFDHLTLTLRQQGVKKIIYKAIPHIYHTSPAQEDLYALFIQKASLLARNISSSICLSNTLGYSKSRLRGINKAQDAGFYVERSNDFALFWQMLEDNLAKKHNTKPTHTLDEMLSLQKKFPHNIILYGAYNNNKQLLGGELIFATKTVAHAQYTAASDEGLENGAIDLVIDHIIQISKNDKRYFDYGISTQNNGLHLNDGLIYQKEGFGARAIVYDIYQIELSQSLARNE